MRVFLFSTFCHLLPHTLYLFSNPGYKRIVRSLLAKVLSSALGGADSHDLEFVDCSFPSSPNNAPHMKFLNQTSPSNSEWAIEFAPSGWTVEAKCSARRAGVRYTVQLKVGAYVYVGNDGDMGGWEKKWSCWPWSL